MLSIKVARNLCFGFALLPVAAAAQSSVDLKLMAPVQDQNPAQIKVVVTSSQSLTGANLDLTAPPGFKIDPATLTLPAFSNSFTEAVTIKSSDTGLLPGKKVITAKLYDPTAGKNKTVLAGADLEFSYAVTDISLRIYFILGMLGIFGGYWIRLLVKVLGSVPVPPPAPVAGVGPITAFVQKHYYLVDIAVTLLLGFLVLVSLVQGTRPPSVASHWYSALSAGVGLGLFTNSELISKLRR